MRCTPGPRAKSGGLYPLKTPVARADLQDMIYNDEPIYETVKREYNWDPDRCEPLNFAPMTAGRHLGQPAGRTGAVL